MLKVNSRTLYMLGRCCNAEIKPLPSFFLMFNSSFFLHVITSLPEKKVHSNSHQKQFYSKILYSIFLIKFAWSNISDLKVQQTLNHEGDMSFAKYIKFALGYLWNLVDMIVHFNCQSDKRCTCPSEECLTEILCRSEWTLSKSVGVYLGLLVEMGCLTHCGYWHSLTDGEY